MQKKLIALAIAGLSGAAFAQSNVTVYGVADVAYDFVSATGGSQNTTNNAVTSIASKGRIATNASYFGLKGSEGLGNGLTAVYQIENEFDFGNGGSTGSNGAAAPTASSLAGNSRQTGLANRDSFVGIAGAFGTVAAGYLSSPHRSLGAKFDLMPGAAGNGGALNIIGRINVGSVLNPLNASGQTSQRFGSTSYTPNTIYSVTDSSVVARQITVNGTAETVSNNVGIIARHAAIAYISPNFNGFQGTVAYVANEAKDNNALGTSAAAANTTGNTYGQRDPRAWNLKFDYDNGPLSLGYSYIDIKDFGVLQGLTATNQSLQGGATAVATGNGGLVQLDLSGKESTKGHLFGAKYTFGGATTVSFMYDRTNTTLNDGPSAAFSGDIKVKRSNWYLGLKHSMGAHDITGAYTKAGKNSVDMGGRAVAGSDYESGSDAQQWTLRYAYNFSKRTSAYAQYTTLRNGGNATYDLGVGGNNATGTGNGGVSAGADPTVVSFGVRHNF